MNGPAGMGDRAEQKKRRLQAVYPWLIVLSCQP